MPNAPVKVHHHTGANIRADTPDLPDDQGPELLSQEKRSHKEKVSMPAEAQVCSKPQGNYEGHRDMYGQEPLQGKASYVGPPVSERDINDQHNDAYDDQIKHTIKLLK